MKKLLKAANEKIPVNIIISVVLAIVIVYFVAIFTSGGVTGKATGTNIPKGNHTSSDCTASMGWACDADNYAQSINISFYADGPAGSTTGRIIGRINANLATGSAVGAQCGGNANHGFRFATPSSIKDNKQHTIYAYAINTPSGTNPNLLGSPRYIQCALPIPSAPTGLTATAVYAGTANSQTNLAWTAVSGAAGYKVYRADPAVGTYSLIASPTTASYSDIYAAVSGSGPGYYYKVSAANSAGESAKSAMAYNFMISNVLLSSASGSNLDSDDLTAAFGSISSQTNLPGLTVVSDWRHNKNSIAVLNMPFEIELAAKNAIDYSVFKNNGVPVNSPVWGLSTIGNVASGAFTFDDTNKYIEISDSSSLSLGKQATFSAWINLAGVSEQYDSIINKWDQTPNDEFILGVSTNRNLMFVWHTTGGGGWGSGSWNEKSSSSQIPLNAWTHVAAVRDVQSLKLYINGNLAYSGTPVDEGTFIDGLNSIRIGAQARGSKNRFFNGMIDNILIFNRALSQEQIQALASANHFDRNFKLANQETQKGDVWSVALIQNYGGKTAISNSLTIV